MKHKMDQESIDALVEYRIQRSKETLSESKLMA